MASPDDIEKARTRTRDIYERSAEQFDKTRSRDGREEQWLQQFVEAIPSGGHILDLGCGMGEPVAAWLIARGYSITGVDYSAAMLDIARSRFPKANWVHADMRVLNLTGPFDGVISWHGSFHLTQDEQRALMPKMLNLLKPKASLMLTTGPKAGEITGTIAGETVYHASLDPDEYREFLTAKGFTEIVHDTEDITRGPFVLYARRG